MNVIFHRLAVLLAGFLVNMAARVTGSSYNNYQYDMAPHFTPDGRLLQVEYASAAADYSAPVILARLSSDLSVIVTVRTHKLLQERIVVLNDCCTVVAMSGVLSDNLALLKVVQDKSLQQLRQFGANPSSLIMTAGQVADTIGQACQEHSFGGGLRPYGATMVVCGLSEYSASANGMPTIVAYQTDPSGAVVSLDGDLSVIGGGSILPIVKRKLESSLGRTATLNNPGKTSPRQAIAKVATILLQEVNNSSSKQRKQKDSQKDSSSSSAESAMSDLHSLEVAVVSRERGVYKLSTDQIRRIILDQ